MPALKFNPVQLKIHQELEGLKDADYRAFTQKLSPGVGGILGVRLPLIRKTAKHYAKEDPALLFEALPLTCAFEDLMAQAMLLGMVKTETEKRLSRIKDFLPRLNGWALCDTLCAGLKEAKTAGEAYFEFILPYFTDPRPYYVRFALVMALNYFTAPKYLKILLPVFDTIDCSHFYVHLGLAWALSAMFCKERDLTLAYLKENRLDDRTFNKALQKILESYKVSKEDKALIRSMRRKQAPI